MAVLQLLSLQASCDGEAIDSATTRLVEDSRWFLRMVETSVETSDD